MLELRASFYGEVQGVGFRATACQIGKKLQLKGFVRNSSDGSVEIVAVGDKITLEEFLLKVKQAFPSRLIQRIEKEFVKPTKEFSDFSISF